jgi:hypothetical protein
MENLALKNLGDSVISRQGLELRFHFTYEVRIPRFILIDPNRSMLAHVAPSDPKLQNKLDLHNKSNSC